MTDPYRLKRFTDAQDTGLYSQALAELRQGRKLSHWIWFVFPQIAGLGSSPMAVEYAISDLDEARAYLAHPVLGPRLHEAAQALLSSGQTDPEAVLGFIDAMKMRSSMTLFHRASPEDSVFTAVLDAFYAGAEDDLTLSLLGT
ncbi:MAG: DUF1810 domain-containing protein [Desulfovibrio sp.]|nr:DUF1810 domain-containing protein [Desulfovibrio sp.]